MADSLTLIDMLLRGIAVGAMAVIGLCFLASDAARNTRVVTALFCLSIVLWLVAESETLAGIRARHGETPMAITRRLAGQ